MKDFAIMMWSVIIAALYAWLAGYSDDIALKVVSALLSIIFVAIAVGGIFVLARAV